MEEVISREIFEELAHTGGIVFSPQEEEVLREEMNRQMDIIRLLEVIPLEDDLPPVIHGNPWPVDVRCPLRGDEWSPFPSPDEIIGQVPRIKDRYIVSPDVVHQTLLKGQD